MGRSKAPSLPIKALSFCRPTELRGWQRNWIHRGAPRPANPVTCFPPGKVVAPATKGGLHFLARRAVVWFYTNWRLLSIHRRPTTTLAPKGETTHYDLCVALLLQIMFAVHARGASNLSLLRTFGPSGRQPSSPKGACP